jgi:hypothetical protein
MEAYSSQRSFPRFGPRVTREPEYVSSIAARASSAANDDSIVMPSDSTWELKSLNFSDHTAASESFVAPSDRDSESARIASICLRISSGRSS